MNLIDLMLRIVGRFGNVERQDGAGDGGARARQGRGGNPSAESSQLCDCSRPQDVRVFAQSISFGVLQRKMIRFHRFAFTTQILTLRRAGR